MRKAQAVLLVISLSFIFSRGALAQENLEMQVKNAPSLAKFPQASGVIMDAVQTFILAKDGRRTSEFFRLVGVFNLTGREKFSDFRIPLDKNTETAELILARTYKPNLSFIDVEKGAINDLTPPYLADADIYSNLIHRVLSFSAVDPGDCLAVHFKKESREQTGNLDEIVYFQTDEPLTHKRLKVVIPKEKTLKYAAVGLKAGFSEEVAAEEKVYQLEAVDSPQVKPEEYMPPLVEIEARILLSTYRDWNEAYAPFSRSFFEAAQPDEDIMRLARELTAKASSRSDQIQKLFIFLARDIRSVRLPFGEGGYAIHSAGSVLKNRYGDWKDKAALLVALLKAVNIEAFPVLAKSDAVPLVEDVPTLKQFDCVLVAVPEGGEYLFLNPFADNSLYGYFQEGRDAKGLIVKPESHEFRQVTCLSGARSFSKNEISAEIGSKGEIKGTVTSELAGMFDLRARKELKDKTAQELDQFYAEAVNRMIDEGQALRSRLSDAKDLAKKISLFQEFRGEEYGIFQGPIMLIAIPQVPYSSAGLLSEPRLDKRVYPFRVSDKSEVSVAIDLKVPKEYKPFFLPESFSQKTDYGDFSFSVSYDPQGSKVQIRQSWTFTKKEIPLDQYPEFKKILGLFGITQNNLILLEKK